MIVWGFPCESRSLPDIYTPALAEVFIIDITDVVINTLSRGFFLAKILTSSASRTSISHPVTLSLPTFFRVICLTLYSFSKLLNPPLFKQCALLLDIIAL